ncbi:MAG: hypothetical protein AB7O32_17600 [Vicinamibacterales bacterium]
MKKLMLAMAVATAACSGNPVTGPTPTSSSLVVAGDAAGVNPSRNPSADEEPTPAQPEPGRATSPQWSLSGPNGCVDSGTDPMQWALTISDAGPSPLRFVALSHHSMEPGCAPTIENARPRVLVAGVLEYPSHATGQTVFTFDPKHYSCGRSQVDVSIFDADGIERLIIGMIVNYGTVCEGPPPTPPTPEPPLVATLTCAPGTQSGAVNQSLTFTATGGSGTYRWTGGGSPAAGQGTVFQTAFAADGTRTVTVASGDQVATCQATVQTPPPPPVVPALACAPGAQAGPVNQALSFSATGGTGTYAWSGGGSPAAGHGTAFQTAFGSAGARAVTVTSGEQTATCQVTVNAPPPPEVPALICAPGSQTVDVNAAVAMSATGGTGTYIWSGGGSPAVGQGAAFQTAFATDGARTVTVTSGDQTATCQVTAKTPPPPVVTKLACTPDKQTTLVNQAVTLTATGGTGAYAWTGGGSPASGQGAAFQTAFATGGTHYVTVRSGDQSALCTVTANTPPPDTRCDEGCTPGYWKQPHHYDSWTGYSPGTPFASVFENAFPGKTLGEVLALNGGGLDALGRHAVAALLNAASPGVDFEVDAATVIREFNRVYPGGDYETLKNRLAAMNERNCPLR